MLQAVTLLDSYDELTSRPFARADIRGSPGGRLEGCGDVQPAPAAGPRLQRPEFDSVLGQHWHPSQHNSKPSALSAPAAELEGGMPAWHKHRMSWTMLMTALVLGTGKIAIFPEIVRQRNTS